MAHDHNIYDSDPHFNIDVDTRAITYVSPAKLVLVQGDHNSEIFTFDMPRLADGHDMLECDIKQIHYINLDSERGILKSTGVYTITDMKRSDEDENKIVFSWTISKNATKYVGSLSFAIRFACSGEESTLDYDWKTLPYASVPVSKTIDSTEDFVEDNYDALQEWYNTLLEASEGSVDAILEAKTESLEDLDKRKDNLLEAMNSHAYQLQVGLTNSKVEAKQEIENLASSVGGIIISENMPTTEKGIAWLNANVGILYVKNENGEFEPLESIKGGLTNITQEFGDNEQLVISQKVITDKINEIETRDQETQNSNTSSFTDIGNRLGSLETKDTEHSQDIEGLGAQVMKLTNEVAAFESKMESVKVFRSGQYTGTGGSLTIDIDMNVEMIIIKDSTFDYSEQLNDLILFRNYQAQEPYNTYSGGVTRSYIIPSCRDGDYLNDNGNVYTHFNFYNPDENRTLFELTGRYVENDSAINDRGSYNAEGVNYYWFAIGYKE